MPTGDWADPCQAAPRSLHCALPRLLAARGMSWSELARRALLPAGTLARIRRADADPPLPVAERVAAALGVAVEAVWRYRR